MPRNDLGHARSLQKLLRTLLASTALGGLGVSVFVACGGAVDDGSTEVPEAPGCVVETPTELDAGACRTFTLRIESGPASCPKTLTGDQCAAICGGTRYCFVTEVLGSITCGQGCLVDGRRPDGLVAAELPRGDLGAHFAAMAFHEAAAALAFAQLESEMRAHGAPASLVRALARAQADEHRHAAAAAAIARRHGGDPPVPRVVRAPSRSLFDIALENAREGCGRELLGAAVGLHIGENASSREIRELFARIARDEVRHAAVSLRMQAWLRARLTPEERRHVDAAMSEALSTASAADLPPELSAPDGAQLARLGRAMNDLVVTYFAEIA